MNDPRRERRPLSRAEWISVALAVLIAVGLAAIWVRHRQAAPSVAAPAAAPAAPSADATTAPPPGPAPAVDESRVRSLLESVSSHPLFRRWLAAGDLVRRWVIVADNVAEGVSPRKQLEFLAPSRPFSVVERGTARLIAPDSYHRYDDFADVVASIDAQALAKVYRELHPALEWAYRALGYPAASLDHVIERALRRIELAPVADGDVAVKPERSTFVFVDPRLEALGPVEKHLLRMGPRNMRLVQAKAREIGLAFGFHAAVEVVVPPR